MPSWIGLALARARSAIGLIATVLLLVAATTGVIAGTVGYTAAAATTSARDAVSGSDELALAIQTHLLPDAEAQRALAESIITDTFAPAPVTIDYESDGEFARFRVLPDVERVQPELLGSFADGAAQIRNALRDSDASSRGVAVEGDLAQAAATASQNLMVSRSLGTVPLSVLALVTLLAVVQVVRLLAHAREPQGALLIARGASPRQAFLLSAAETAAAVLLGAVVGAGLALAAMQLVPGGAAQWRLVLGAATACLTGSLAIVLAVLALQVRTVATPGYSVDRSGRTSRAVTGVTLLLVLAGAALALWQLARSGSPLTVTDDATYSVNLVAGAAPVLLLAAAGFVAIGLLGPIGALLTALLHPLRGAGAYLSAAQVSRHLRVYAVPVVLTVLATGATTMAALYAGTSAQLRDDMIAVADGAALRATLPGNAIPGSPDEAPGLVPGQAGIEGLGAVTPVWITDGATIGDAGLIAAAVIPDRISDVLLPRAGAPAIPAEFAEPDPAARAGAGSIPIPEGTSRVDVIASGGMTLDAWGLEFLEQQETSVRMMAVAAGREAEEEIAEDVRAAIATAVGDLEAPHQLRVRVFVRDVDTGVTKAANLGAAVLPGPRIAWDEVSNSGFTATAAPTTTRLSLELDPTRRFAIDAIEIGTTDQGAPDDFGWGSPPGARTVQLDLALRTDAGRDLLGDVTGWSSPQATTPDRADALLASAGEPVVVYEEWVDAYVWLWRSNKPFSRVGLDTSEPTWRIRGSERADFYGSPISAAYSPADASPGVPVEAPEPVGLARVALTPDAAGAAGLEVGDRFETQFMNRRLASELVGLVDAVPGTIDPHAALLDVVSLGQQFGSVGVEFRGPTEVWAASDDPLADAGLLADAVSAVEVRPGGLASPTDPTSAARLIFWVACGGAILLAATGIAAATVALTDERRPEVAVLRALGMTPSGQARSRVGELAAVVGAATAFGLLAGWLVSGLVVPPLAQSTTAPGAVRIDPGLTLQLGPWLALLGGGAALVAALLLWLARRVRGQALDNTYREEVR